ncbi:MAG: DUF3822 family protein [Bacteroidota bacterium]
MGTIGHQELIDSKFSELSTSVYNLSVLAGTDRLSYFLQDKQHTVLFLRSYDFPAHLETVDLVEQIRSVYLQDELLRQSYRRVSIGVANKKSTLVPDRLYTKGEESTYLKNLVLEEHDFSLYSDHLEEMSVRNVFRLDGRLKNFIDSSFGAASIFHQNSALILAFQKLAASRAGHQLFVNIRHKSVQLFAFEQKQLLFCNSFDFQSSKDFIYYIMLAFDQLGLKPEVVPVVLSGQIAAQSEIYRLLYRYIRHLSMAPKPDYLQFGAAFDQLPPHFFFELYSLQLCGL